MDTCFASWAELGRTGVVGACGGVALIVLLRTSGKRGRTAAVEVPW